MTDTLKQIAEDALLLAANILTDESNLSIPEDLTGEDREAAVSWRITELVVNVAERIVAVSGLDPAEMWVPKAVNDIFDGGDA